MRKYLDRGLALVALVGAALMPFAPAQADFKLFSQNALHLGWLSSADAKYAPKKYIYLKSIAQSADIILLQEVMNDDPVTEITIPNYTAYISPVAKGVNGYLEKYLALVNTAKVKVICHVSLPNNSAYNLVRPPDLLLVRSIESANYTWIVNFHAVWGDYASERSYEAREIFTLVSKLETDKPSSFSKGCSSVPNAVKRVVVAGDWNLQPRAMEKIWGNTPAPGPTTQTTIKPSGGLSKSYDHFVLKNVEPADPASPAVFQPGTFWKGMKGYPTSLSQFRGEVSDHLGVWIQIID